MIKRLILPTATVLAVAAAAPVQAIPAFARRYGVSCHFCHDGYPKLNPMGYAFRARGFRMEKEEAFELDKWARSVPLILRASGTHYFFEGAEDVNQGFFKGISAGNLGQRLSYWVDDGVLVHKRDAAGDHFTHTKPDNAWARLELIRAGKLYLKGGRLELDLPFTQTRTPHLFSYDIYFANTGSESDAIGFFQDGVEVGGALPHEVHWSAAVVAGHDAPNAGDINSRTERFDGDVFLRLAKRFDRHRVGGFAYIGRNTLARSATNTADDNLLRLGADLSVWIERLNLYGVAMYGRNDNSILDPRFSGGTGQPLSFSGGFAQADYHVRDFAVLTLRGNLVSRPPGSSAGPRQTFASVFPGLQLYYEHLKVSFEYGFLNRNRNDFGAVQVDLAF
jgi:hypothetical protein